jgi:predicted SAM-dependent methyltransferase
MMKIVLPGNCLIFRFLQLFRLSRLPKGQTIKIYYGCGTIRQEGYINVDLRWTPVVDFIGDLEWCARVFKSRCSEVYLSHVLEHYSSPGKIMRSDPDTVLGALSAIWKMLISGGTIRLAVPDFAAISRLYMEGIEPFFPRLHSRIHGGQDYRENVHLCTFDRDFLEQCLKKVGFSSITMWDPEKINLSYDSSFDRINGFCTSLNLMALKQSLLYSSG